jgi:hypothetical protein
VGFKKGREADGEEKYIISSLFVLFYFEKG